MRQEDTHVVCVQGKLVSPPRRAQAASDRALSGLKFHGSNSSMRLLAGEDYTARQGKLTFDPGRDGEDGAGGGARRRP